MPEGQIPDPDISKVKKKIKDIGDSPINVNLWIQIFALLVIAAFFTGWFVSGIYYEKKVRDKVNTYLEQVFDEINRCVNDELITPSIRKALIERGVCENNTNGTLSCTDEIEY